MANERDMGRSQREGEAGQRQQGRKEKQGTRGQAPTGRSDLGGSTKGQGGQSGERPSGGQRER